MPPSEQIQPNLTALARAASEDDALALDRPHPIPQDPELARQFEALSESIADMLAEHKKAVAETVRREVDRILYILLGCAGMTMGGVLWMILKP
ncbi:MAG: hypothetical protein NTZ56_22350 [Acidobacteria bacterium]|nr:hypothetical protein [Acidobacteriota bacterium]